MELRRWVLPTPGGPQMKRGLYAWAWHFGDRQRRGMGEAVAVADDELLEGQLGVAAGARRLWIQGGIGSGRDVFAVGCVRGDELDGQRGPEDVLSRGSDQAAEAVARPAAGVRRRCDDQPSGAEGDGVQGLEPDTMGLLPDRTCELCLYACPYVLELVAHGSQNPLLSREKP